MHHDSGQTASVRAVVVGSDLLRRDAVAALLVAAGVQVRDRDSTPERELEQAVGVATDREALGIVGGAARRVLVVDGAVDGSVDDAIVVDVRATPDQLLQAVLDGVAAAAVVPIGTAVPVGRASALVDGLTPRERDVLAQLVTGDDSIAIGERLGISEHTVRTHVQNLMPKLGVNTRSDAAVLALDSGLVSAEAVAS